MLVGNTAVSFISEAHSSPYSTERSFWILIYVTEYL